MKKRQTKISQVTKLQKALEKEQEKSNQYLTRLKYLQADFENFRKRMTKEVNEVAQLGNAKLVISLLEVLDALELAIRSGRETEHKKALLEGVEMTLKKMHDLLKQEGLTKIEALGKSFDPKMHEVVMKIPTENEKENIIVEEVRPGYLLHGKVIRPSIVKITVNRGVNS